MRAFCVLGVVLLAMLPSAVSAKQPPPNLAELDRALSRMLQEGHVPGASVAIVENGRVVLAKGYGYADVAKRVKATADTPFRAGSISKGFTSIAIMMLVEQKKLSLDDRLAAFAPEVHFVNPWEKTNPIRLANLLEHTTGWPDIGPRVLEKNEQSWTTLQGVQFSSDGYVSRWKPGQFTVYNNAGPGVAALALEKAAGRDYSTYMRENVLRPLGMAHADFDLTPEIARTIAKSYAPGGTETPYQHIVIKPAGSLNISARELAQLVRFYLFNGFVDGHRLLSPASIARIETSETNLASKDGFHQAYALGNAAFPDSGMTFRGHNGGIDSFTSVMGYNRRSNSGYVLMANGGEGVDFATPMAHMVQAYLTRDWKMTPAPTVKLSAAELARYAGYYRIITPPNDLLRPYAELLNIGHVTAGDGRLVVGAIVSSGNDFFPISAHVFRRADREDASLAFVEDSGNIYKLGAFNAAVKAPFWYVPALLVVVLLIVLGTFAGIAMLGPWIYFKVKQRLRGGLLLRVMPLLSVAMLAAMLALPFNVIISSGTSAWHSLAIVGPTSLMILLASVLFPLFALGGLVLAIRNAEARTLIRSYVAATSVALLIASGYFASIGWFALRTWQM